MSHSLLEQVRGLLERTYDHRTLPGPLAPFVLGDQGFRRMLRGRELTQRVGADDDGAQVLLRPGPNGRIRAGLYFPDRLIRRLEAQPPGRDLHGGNIDAFATFVEEIDHLLLLASRARSGPELSLLELELHANVSKELVLRHFLARLCRVERLPRRGVAWLRHHLFHKHRFSDPDPAIRTRYREAGRMALRYLQRLDGVPARRRLQDLRRFSRMTHHQKVALLQHAA